MNPIRIVSVFWVNVRLLVRDKGGLFFTFAFPIILMLLFGFIFQDSDRTEYDIHIQDLDMSDSSRNLTEAISAVPSFRYREVAQDKDPHVLAREEVNFIVVIGEGYERDLNARMGGYFEGPVNITVLYDPSQSSTQLKMSILASVLDGVNDAMQNSTQIIGIEPESIVSERFRFIEFFIPGVIGLTVMTGAVFGTIFGDLELKQKGIFRKLSTTPITRGEWILSTMLFQLFSAGLSTSVILIVGRIVFDAKMFLNPVALLVVIFEAFAFTGLAMLVVRFIKESQSASALGNAITFPMMFLSGTFFQVEAMPPFIQTIAKLMPLYYVNESLRRAMIFNDTIGALRYMSVIAVFALIVFIAGVYLTSWRND